MFSKMSIKAELEQVFNNNNIIGDQISGYHQVYGFFNNFETKIKQQGFSNCLKVDHAANPNCSLYSLILM